MRAWILVAAGLLVATSAAAQSTTATPGAADRMLACRSIADAAQRLACYDAETGAFAQAQQSGDVVVVDREQIRATNRSLFGFSLPDLARLGGSSDEVQQLTYTVRSARQSAYGDLVIEMDDGSVWRQTAGRQMLRPRPGASVTVERGHLGGYLMSIEGSASIRVARAE